MEKLTTRQTTVLEVLDAQIEELEEKLRKAQPFIDELNKLRATRRVLLSEKSMTSGGGNNTTRLTMEQLVHFMRAGDATNEDDALPVSIIAQKLGVPDATVRSHLNRSKDTRYAQADNGAWYLIGEDSDDQ